MSLKILEINLSDHAWSMFTVGKEDVSLYLGGKGLGLKILSDRMAPGIDPLGPENMLTFVVFQEADLRYLKRFSRHAKAEIVVFNENLINCVNSLSTCLMTLSAYPLMSPVVRFTPRPLLAFFMQNMPAIAMKTIDLSIYADFFTAITGIAMNKQKLLKAGERIHVLERYMNTREGISRKDDTLPARFINHGLEIDGANRTVPLTKMLDCYYRTRGFDTDGIPTEKLLNKLKINKNNNLSGERHETMEPAPEQG